MILYQSEYNGKKIEIGVAYMPNRRKPCLVIRDGNAVTKYESFNNEYAAREFMDMFADFLGIPRVDWTGDDVPWGLLSNCEDHLPDPTKKVLEALQTVKDFCKQTDFNVCNSGQCVLRKWCNYTTNGNRTGIPELWQIPQERTEE